jgi:alpha-L-fucosidase 2
MRGVNAESQGIKGALRFEARVRVVAQGGAVSSDKASIAVTGADSVTLLLAAATSYRSFKDVTGDPRALTTSQLAGAGAKSFDALLQAHVAEHRRLFRRVALDLGSSEAARRATDERIRDFTRGGDPQLAALYFQFGRYTADLELAVPAHNQRISRATGTIR